MIAKAGASAPAFFVMCTDVVEAAIRECFLSYGALPGAAVARRDDFLAVRTSIPITFFNGVAHAVPRPEDAETRVGEAIAFFRETSTPFRWWITPSSRPANLIDILIANGLRHVYDAPGMAVDLRSLPAMRGDLTIQRIEDREALAGWVSVFAATFSRPEQEMTIWRDTYVAFRFDGPWRHFVGLLDGRPVATSSVCLAPDVAGIYHVATLPQARGRGLGAAVTLAALQEAKDAGCRVAALQSSAMAFTVYRSLGFRHCCDLALYDWRPEYE